MREEPELPLELPVDVEPKRKQSAKRYVDRRRARRAFLGRTAFGKVVSGLEEVDHLLFQIGDAMGIDAAQASSVMYALVARKRVPEWIGKLYDTLRDARNLLAHSQTLLDEPEAVEYVRSYLRAILQILKESLKPKADKSGEEK
jgi:hypothetical protein